MVEAESR